MRLLALVLWMGVMGPIVPNWAPAATVVTSFRVISADGGVPGELRYAPSPEHASVEVQFQTDRFSTLHDYRGPNPLVFFREVRGAVGAPSRFPVASAQLPSGAVRVLLVFLPGGDRSRSEEFRVVALPDPEPAAARGTVRFLNLASAQLLVKLGEENRELAAGRFEDFRFRTAKVERVPHGLAVLRENEWKVIFDSDLVLSRDRRYFMLILPPPPSRPDSLRFRLKLLEE